MLETDINTILKLGGVSAVVVWGIFVGIKYVFVKLFDQVSVTQREQSARIDSAEKRIAECDEDRKYLREQMIALLQKTTPPHQGDARRQG